MAVTPTPDLFRKAALDRLASPEQLDELVTVADTKGWIAGLGLSVVTAALVTWGFTGSIPTEVPAQGILITEGGRVVAAVSPASGVIASLTAKPGEVVQRGQLIATIRQPGAELQLASARQVVTERAEMLAARLASLRREADALEENAARRGAAQRQIMRQANERIERLNKQLDIRQQLRAQNLALEERVEQTRVELSVARQDVSAAAARLVEIDSELLHARLEADREIAAMRVALAVAERAVTETTLSLTETRDVLAPVTGHVTEVDVTTGQLISAGAHVLNVETEGRHLQAVVYVPTEHGKKVFPGMTVRIALSTVKKEEWGTLFGRVASIASFPATPQGMAAVLQNSRLVQSFGGQSPPYEARIDLQPAGTPTGYAWSSGNGPELDLTSGTTLRAEITVHREPPINLILPLVRQAAGFAR